MRLVASAARLVIDRRRNDTAHDRCDISAAAAVVRTVAVTATAGLQIAREARQLLDTR